MSVWDSGDNIIMKTQRLGSSFNDNIDSHGISGQDECMPSVEEH